MTGKNVLKSNVKSVLTFFPSILAIHIKPNSGALIVDMLCFFGNIEKIVLSINVTTINVLHLPIISTNLINSKKPYV